MADKEDWRARGARVVEDIQVPQAGIGIQGSDRKQRPATLRERAHAGDKLATEKTNLPSLANDSECSELREYSLENPLITVKKKKRAPQQKEGLAAKKGSHAKARQAQAEESANEWLKRRLLGRRSFSHMTIQKLKREAQFVPGLFPLLASALVLRLG